VLGAASIALDFSNCYDGSSALPVTRSCRQFAALKSASGDGIFCWFVEKAHTCPAHCHRALPRIEWREPGYKCRIQIKRGRLHKRLKLMFSSSSVLIGIYARINSKLSSSMDATHGAPMVFDNSNQAVCPACGVTMVSPSARNDSPYWTPKRATRWEGHSQAKRRRSG